MFSLAMDINFVLDYNNLIEVDHVFDGINTIYSFSDQSKQIPNYKKKLPLLTEEQIFHSQIISAFVNQQKTIYFSKIQQDFQ